MQNHSNQNEILPQFHLYAKQIHFDMECFARGVAEILRHKAVKADFLAPRPRRLTGTGGSGNENNVGIYVTRLA